MNPPLRSSAPPATRVTRAHVGGALLISLAFIGGLLAVLTPTAAVVLRYGAPSLADLVLLTVGSVGLLTAAWYALTAVILLACAQRSPGRMRRLAALIRRWGAPGLRGLATTGAVIGLLGVGSSALATPTGSFDDLSWGNTTAASNDAVPDVSFAPSTEPVLADGYTVQVGDCLWNIARSSLPEGASNASIAREWQRWYQQNRVVIGANPNLLYPGQILRAPTAP